MDSPTSRPEGLNVHAHSLQAQPRKFCLSAHTSLRRITTMAPLEIWFAHSSLKHAQALVFDGTATTKTAFFISPSGPLPKSSLLEHACNRCEHTRPAH